MGITPAQDATVVELLYPPASRYAQLSILRSLFLQIALVCVNIILILPTERVARSVVDYLVNKVSSPDRRGRGDFRSRGLIIRRLLEVEMAVIHRSRAAP